MEGPLGHAPLDPLAFALSYAALFGEKGKNTAMN
jgi:hypothetical protein